MQLGDEIMRQYAPEVRASSPRGGQAGRGPQGLNAYWMKYWLNVCNKMSSFFMESVLSIRDVYRASQLLDEQKRGLAGLDFTALRGRLTELCVDVGHAPVTLAVDLIAQAHRAGEPAAWIGADISLFYPPDATGWSLDWSALAIIRLGNAHRAARGADKLLRSGAFGLVVVDLVGVDGRQIPDPLLGRLMRLAETHDSAAVFLTQSRSSSASLSSLIALRVGARWCQTDPERLRAHFTVLKDKCRGPGRTFDEAYNGPLGLY